MSGNKQKEENVKNESVEEQREMIVYEEDHAQALYMIEKVDDYIEVEFFEDDIVLNFPTIVDFLGADLSTFERAERAKKEVIVEKLNQEE